MKEPGDMKPFDLSPAHRPTAITVMRNGTDYLLCPFFGKCDGLLMIDPASTAVEFKPNAGRSAEYLSDLIIGSQVARVICGFVPAPERAKLRAAGIDIRLGSCACGIDELIVEFADLPKA